MREWIRRPLGVSPPVAEKLRRLLEPGEELRFVMLAETKRTLPRLVANAAAIAVIRSTPRGLLGRILVLITDRAVLFVDREREVPMGDRVLFAELPLPTTFGPVDGAGWIVLGGQPMFVPGGRRTIERAEAALRA
jgi:hypothetical protein